MNAFPTPAVFSFQGLTYQMEYGSKKMDIPFAIKCRDFQLDRYPGSNSPSSFASEVTILDKKNNYKDERRIFMNNVSDYGGYRFFQSGYSPDEKQTHLSVSYDWWGTNISYLGYLMMAIGMVLSLFASNGRFRNLFRIIKTSIDKSKTGSSIIAVLVVSTAMLFSSQSSMAQEMDTIEHSEHESHDHSGHDHSEHNHAAEGEPQVQQEPTELMHFIISEEHSENLASLLVQERSGRIVPMHTICLQLLRKIHRSDTYKEYNAVQTLMSMHVYWDWWSEQDIIYISSKGGLRDKLKLKGKYCSYNDLLDDKDLFIFAKDHIKSNAKAESKRDEFDKQIIKLNEKYQILRGVFTVNWQFLKILPIKDDEKNTWANLEFAQKNQVDGFKLTIEYLGALSDVHLGKGGYGVANDKLEALKKYQRELGKDVVPTEDMVEMEINYNEMRVFKNSYMLYGLFGAFLLILFLIKVFVGEAISSSLIFKIITGIMAGLMIFTFLYHGYGLYMRTMITGEAPWTNGYEALVFIAWVLALTGLVFSRFNMAILAGAGLMAFFILFVADLNLLDPEITTLQPVLKSYWLMIHVAVITGSYAPLGIACILGLINLILYIFRTKSNNERVGYNINVLTAVTEMTMTIGLFMLTIGTFLGGIWANESWGRYWGWDPKETWALVAVLVYAIILHLRYIPALKDKFTFNVLALWGYASILFTFFGVNFYLVGLHSYANGEGLGEIPSWIIYTIVVFYLFTELASIRNQLRLSKGAMVPMKHFTTKLIILLACILFSAALILIFGVSDFIPMSGPLFQIIGLIIVTNALTYGVAYLVSQRKSSVEIEEI